MYTKNTEEENKFKETCSSLNKTRIAVYLEPLLAKYCWR